MNNETDPIIESRKAAVERLALKVRKDVDAALVLVKRAHARMHEMEDIEEGIPFDDLRGYPQIATAAREVSDLSDAIARNI